MDDTPWTVKKVLQSSGGFILTVETEEGLEELWFTRDEELLMWGSEHPPISTSIN
jgi:hypothetical protein